MKSYTNFIAEIKDRDPYGSVSKEELQKQFEKAKAKAERQSRHGDLEWYVYQDIITLKIQAFDDAQNNPWRLLGTAFNGKYTNSAAISYTEYGEESFTPEESELISEILSFAGRRALKRSAKKRKARLAVSRRIAKKRTAPLKKITNRASRRARRKIAAGISGGKLKSNMSHAGLNRLQQMVNARHGMLDQLRRKMIPQVRADERKRKRGH